MKYSIFFLLNFLLFSWGYGQDINRLSFSEFLGHVKKHHPIVKQANLIISESEAKLLKARGAFDPKLDVDFDRKNFKNTTYYNKFNSTFKVPTWFGVDLKGNYAQNSGMYLDPEANLPEEGLYNLGVSIALGKGLFINRRMATLKQAKLYRQQAKAENQLLVNSILYEALISYLNWLKRYREKMVFKEFMANAALRFEGVKKSYALGERPVIDTIEARIALNNRRLNLEKSELAYTNASLELSNFLWINDVPLELQSNVIPDQSVVETIDEALQLNGWEQSNELLEHPKLKSLDYKYRALTVEQRLMRNNLLPQINLQYNFLNSSRTLDAFNVNNFKTMVSMRIPLFLRKERGALKLANYKLQAVDYERSNTLQNLKNKRLSVRQKIQSYDRQMNIAENLVADYAVLLNGEERKFTIGESSLFLVNSREAKLIESKLKVIELENNYLKSKGDLFNVQALSFDVQG